MNYKLTRNEPLLAAAYDAWRAMDGFRQRRARFKRFTYGDQWSDIVDGPDGPMTAADVARSAGRRPMTNNLLRRLVKSVIGRFRYQRDEARPLEGEALDNYRANNLDELDCRSLEEFLISGCAVQRVAPGRSLRGSGRWVDPVSPDAFFATPIADPRGWDTELVGMVHDWSLHETLVRLAGQDLALATAIRGHYTLADLEPELYPSIFGDASPFFGEPPRGRCRVIEVWTLEVEDIIRCTDPEASSIFTMGVNGLPRVEAINADRRNSHRREISYRWAPRTRWRCHWMAPDGTVLLSHGPAAGELSHPFHFRFYPLIDGEIHPFVEDVIDQQIYINELISLIDHIVSCSAKGVLLFPSDMKLSSMTWSDVCRAWSAPGGVIPVRTNDNRMPQQIHSQGTNLGATELLATEMRMFEDVSGVANALMGRSSSGNIGAEHYESQVKNAIIAIADLLETFNNFIDTRNSALC